MHGHTVDSKQNYCYFQQHHFWTQGLNKSNNHLQSPSNKVVLYSSEPTNVTYASLTVTRGIELISGRKTKRLMLVKDSGMHAKIVMLNCSLMVM